MKKPIFARNMEFLYSNFSKIFGQNITSLLIRNTVGKQFIAGENNQEMI